MHLNTERETPVSHCPQAAKLHQHTCEYVTLDAHFICLYLRHEKNSTHGSSNMACVLAPAWHAQPEETSIMAALHRRLLHHKCT